MVEIWVYGDQGWYRSWFYPWWDTTPKRIESKEQSE